MFKVECKIDGLKDLLKKVDDLDKRMRGSILRKAVGAGGKILTKSMKQNLKAFKANAKTLGKGWSMGDTGLTKKSIGSKVKLYRRSGVAVAIAGPRTGFKKQIGTVTRGKSKGKPKFRNPTAIAHLIEKGTKERVGKTGKHSGAMSAFPFVRPAVMRSRSAVRDKMVQVLTDGLAGAGGGSGGTGED
jgi:HK97 gp10 family phage protein